MFCTILSVGAWAQKGQKAVGVNLLYGTEAKNLGIGVKGQYNFTDALRGEAAFDYFLKKDGVNSWDVNVSAHYLFPIKDKLTLYPLAGVTYTHWSTSYEVVNYKVNMNDADAPNMSITSGKASASSGKFGIHFGGGAQYDLTDNLVLNAELKYQLVSSFDQGVISVGVAYKF